MTKIFETVDEMIDHSIKLLNNANNIEDFDELEETVGKLKIFIPEAEMWQTELYDASSEVYKHMEKHGDSEASQLYEIKGEQLEEKLGEITLLKNQMEENLVKIEDFYAEVDNYEL